MLLENGPGRAADADAALLAGAWERRQQVVASGSQFNDLYGKTKDILERHMTLRPPARRHSFACGDLSAYAEG
jgi:hypothetical protein